MRGRGLKRDAWYCRYFAKRSPPMRGRGLKPHRLAVLNGGCCPPLAGAWIEIDLDQCWRWFKVAPHAGARIETASDLP